MRSEAPEISVIAAVRDEAENILPLCDAIAAALDGRRFETIFVDDGSEAATVRALEEAVSRHDFVRVLFMGRRLGKGPALMAGCAAAASDLVVTIDADMQNDPADIPALLEALREAHVVVGRRVRRADSVARIVQSRLFNAALRLACGCPLRDANCGLRAFRRRVLDNPALFTDRHRIFPALAHILGYTVREIPVGHHPRRRHRSKYGPTRAFSAFSDVLLAALLRRFWRHPGLLFGLAGAVSFLLGVVVLLYLLYLRLSAGSIGWRYPLLATGVVALLLGVQLVLSGFLAESLLAGARRHPPSPVRALPVREDEEASP